MPEEPEETVGASENTESEDVETHGIKVEEANEPSAMFNLNISCHEK